MLNLSTFLEVLNGDVKNKPSLQAFFTQGDDNGPHIIGGSLTSNSSGGAVLRWNSSGNLESIPHNLVDYSADLSQWTATNVSAAGGATPPDGVGDAYTLTLSGGSVQHFVSRNQTVTVGRPATYSIYAKEGTLKRLVIWSGDNGQEAAFDLDTVSVVGSSGMTGAITSVGDGWYRVSGKITSLANGGSRAFRVYALPDTGTGTGDATFSDDGATLLLAGAQVEEHTALRVYRETTGSAFYDFIIQNNADGTSGGRRLANVPSFTTSVKQSEDFSTTWSAARASVSTNQIAAPDGATTADELVEDSTAGDTHGISQSLSFTSGTAYTYSVYAKKNARDHIYLRLPASAFPANVSAVFDLTNITVESAGAGLDDSGIEDVGDGWVLCYVTATADATTSGNVDLFLHDGSSEAYNGDGSSSAYIWGAMVTNTSYHVGVYLPTTTAARTYNGSANHIVTTGGYSVYYVEFELDAIISGEFQQIFNHTQNGAFGAERIQIAKENASDKARVTIITGSSTVANITAASALVAGTRYKAAIGVAPDDVWFVLNGTLEGTDTDTGGAMADALLDRINLGWNPGGSERQQGGIFEFRAYANQRPSSFGVSLTE